MAEELHQSSVDLDSHVEHRPAARVLENPHGLDRRRPRLLPLVERILPSGGNLDAVLGVRLAFQLAATAAHRLLDDWSLDHRGLRIIRLTCGAFRKAGRLRMYSQPAMPVPTARTRMANMTTCPRPCISTEVAAIVSAATAGSPNMVPPLAASSAAPKNEQPCNINYSTNYGKNQ